MNPYEILGVTEDASPDELRVAYRRRAAEWHPDRCPDPVLVEEWNEQLKNILWAWETVSDPEALAAWRAGDDSSGRRRVEQIATEILMSVVSAVVLAPEQVLRTWEIRHRLSAIERKVADDIPMLEKRVAQAKRISARIGGDEHNLLKELTLEQERRAEAELLEAKYTSRAILVAKARAEGFSDSGYAPPTDSVAQGYLTGNLGNVRIYFDDSR